MTLKTLDESCWVTGDDDTGNHYASEDEAADAVDGEPDPVVRQLPSRCLVAQCDGCGDYFGDDEYTVLHAGPPTMASLESYLSSYEWTVTADGKAYCDSESET